eukprot:scaffold98644_cov72-Phaeocystis_antarctica.AAC.1
MITVDSWNWSRTVLWIRASVTVSMFAVASSSSSTLVRSNKARARHSSCRSPTLRLAPPSDTVARRPPSSEATRFLSCTSSSVSHSSASLYALRGDKLSAMEPAKRKGDCMMSASLGRSSCSPMVPQLMPSISMVPPCGSLSRKSAAIKLLLPAPDLPHTPTREPAATSKQTFSRVGASSGLKRIETLWNKRWPCCGQSIGGGAAVRSASRARNTRALPRSPALPPPPRLVAAMTAEVPKMRSIEQIASKRKPNQRPDARKWKYVREFASCSELKRAVTSAAIPSKARIVATPESDSANAPKIGERERPSSLLISREDASETLRSHMK